VLNSVVCVQATGRLELQKILDQIYGWYEISITVCEYSLVSIDLPSRGALGMIVCNGALACLARGALMVISG
jgi:hypothetical protein